MFWSLKHSGEVLNKFKSREFRATSLSTYDFFTLYTTLAHTCTLIKEKLLDLIERTFKREETLYLACNDKKLWSCQNVYGALSYILDNIYIRFGTKL